MVLAGEISLGVGDLVARLGVEPREVRAQPVADRWATPAVTPPAAAGDWLLACILADRRQLDDLARSQCSTGGPALAPRRRDGSCSHPLHRSGAWSGMAARERRHRLRSLVVDRSSIAGCRDPAVPGAAAAPAGDPRARPTSSSARSWRCARTSCRRSVTDELKNLLDRLPAVPFERFLELIANGPRRRPGDRLRLDRPRADRLGVDRPDPPRPHPRRRARSSSRWSSPASARRCTATPCCSSMLGPAPAAVSSRGSSRSGSSTSSATTPCARSTCGARPTTPRPSPPTSATCPTSSSRKIYRAAQRPRRAVHGVLRRLQARLGRRRSSCREEERDRLVDLGAAAIIRMLYPRRLLPRRPAPGQPDGPARAAAAASSTSAWSAASTTSCGGRCSTTTTAWSPATPRTPRAISPPSPSPAAGRRPDGFRREVEEICRRWSRTANFKRVLARPADHGVGGPRRASYRMYFPVEMVLMVKALVTFEGVGQLLKPGLRRRRGVAEARQPASSSTSSARCAWRGRAARRAGTGRCAGQGAAAGRRGAAGARTDHAAAEQNPFAGVRRTLLAGFCLVGGAIVAGIQRADGAVDRAVPAGADSGDAPSVAGFSHSSLSHTRVPAKPDPTARPRRRITVRLKPDTTRAARVAQPLIHSSRPASTGHYARPARAAQPLIHSSRPASAGRRLTAPSVDDQFTTCDRAPTVLPAPVVPDDRPPLPAPRPRPTARRAHDPGPRSQGRRL